MALSGIEQPGTAPLPTEPPPSGDLPAPPPEPPPENEPPPLPPEEEIAPPPIEPLSPVRCEIIIEDQSGFGPRDPTVDMTEAEPMDLVDSDSSHSSPQASPEIICNSIEDLSDIPLPAGIPAPGKSDRQSQSSFSEKFQLFPSIEGKFIREIRISKNL